MSIEASLSPKTIVISGAGRGVGEASARLLAGLGSRLVLNDLGCDLSGQGEDPSVLSRVSKELGATSVFGDAADPAIAAEIAQAAGAAIHGLVVTTGIAMPRSAARLRDADFDQAMRAGFHAARQLCAAHFEGLKEGRGSVVLCAGADAYRASAQSAATAAAGAALIAYARTIALEWRRYGISVNVVIPTARTRLSEDTTLFRSITSASMTPQEPAQLIAYLLSEGAQGISGEIFGSAGARTYAIQFRETAGLYVEGGASAEKIASDFSEVTDS